MRHVTNTAWIALVSLLLGACVTARAADPKSIDPVGRPDQFKEGKRTLVAVWFEGGVWHVNATAKDHKDNRKATLEGTVTVQKGRITSGTLDGVEQAKPSERYGKNRKRDRKYKEREATDDDLAVHANNAGFDFRFTSRGGSDGVSFKLSDKAETVTFTIRLSGDANPKQIVIGKASANPNTATFTLPARPGADSAPKK